MSWLGGMPWPAVRRAISRLRTSVFTAPRPEGPYLLVEGHTVGELEEVLGVQSFAPNWEQSYYKRGEDLNLAKVVYSSGKGGRGPWWQTHVRGWEEGDMKVALTAHWEMEPTENPGEHLNEVGFGRSRGMTNLKRALRQASVGFETVEWSSEDGIAMTPSGDPRKGQGGDGR